MPVMPPQQEEGLAEIFQMTALKDVAQSPLPVGAGSGPAWLRGLQGRCTKGLSLPGDLPPPIPGASQPALSANCRADYQRVLLRLEPRISVCFPQSQGGPS